MLKRIITSLVGLVFFFGLLFIPENGIYFNCALSVVIFIMLNELYRSVKTNKLLYFSGYASAALILAAIIFYKEAVPAALAMSAVIYLISMVFLHGKVQYSAVISHSMLTYYITFFMGSLITIRNEYDVFAVLLVFICAWTTDTGAYFTGFFIGKHKLIPHVSPKKTVEGAIGGVLTCVLCVFVYTRILNLLEVKSTLYICIFALVISVLSQFGDFVASAIKRDCDIKDFGHLLPGHGGLMDRFDSVAFITPMVLYMLKFI